MTELKGQRNKFIFMATKMEVAATQMKMQMVQQQVVGGIAKATACMQGLQGMSSEQVGVGWFS